jgi:hypothetical protein
MPSILYLLQIGATGRSDFLEDDEQSWQNCLENERTREEEKVLRKKFRSIYKDPSGDGMLQMRTLTHHFSRSSKHGSNSCPPGVKQQVVDFASHIVSSHNEYHTFLLCVSRHTEQRMSSTVSDTPTAVLEPLGRAAFAHLKSYIRDCLIVKDESRDHLQKCYSACLRLTMRFGIRCGSCGKIKGARVLRCCSKAFFCSKACQAAGWEVHKKICGRRSKKKDMEDKS